MKRPTFLEGVGVALVACVIGGILYAVLPPLFGWENPLRALIAGLGLAYILYLLNRSQARVGKVTVASFWLAGAVALWLVHPPFTVYLLFHAGAVWLVRSLYFYGGLIPAALDLALTGFGPRPQYQASSMRTKSTSWFLRRSNCRGSMGSHHS